jgi:hypothetical protein
MTTIRIQKTGEVKYLTNLTADDVVLLDDHNQVIIKIYSDYTAKGHRGVHDLDIVEISDELGTTGIVPIATPVIGAVGDCRIRLETRTTSLMKIRIFVPGRSDAS